MTARIAATPWLQVDGLTVAYPAAGGTVTVVDGFDVVLEPGRLHCIVGRSGSGKTSILRQVAGLQAPTPGTVAWRLVDDAPDSPPRDLTELSLDERADLRRRTAAYVDQEAALVDDLSCLENVLLPALPDGRRAVRRARPAAERWLGDLGLAGQLDQRPATLSGGERQRAAVARALAADTPVVLADEPTASLDRRWADEVVRLLRAHADAGGAVLAVSHDPALAEAADAVDELERG